MARGSTATMFEDVFGICPRTCGGNASSWSGTGGIALKVGMAQMNMIQALNSAMDICWSGIPTSC